MAIQPSNKPNKDNPETFKPRRFVNDSSDSYEARIKRLEENSCVAGATEIPKETVMLNEKFPSDKINEEHTDDDKIKESEQPLRVFPDSANTDSADVEIENFIFSKRRGILIKKKIASLPSKSLNMLE